MNVWKFNAARGMNGAGYVFLVMTAVIVVLALLGKEQPGTMSPMQRVLFLGVPFLILSLLLILRRSEFVYFPNENLVKVGKGFLPVVKWREVTVTGKKSVVLSASRVKGSPIFECNLFFESSPERFCLVGSGSEKDLKKAIDFAHGVDAEVVVEPSMQAIGGPWLKKYLPESFT